MLYAIGAAVLGLMGLYFFEPAEYGVFTVTQLFWVMSLGVALAGLDTDTARQAMPSAGAVAAE